MQSTILPTLHGPPNSNDNCIGLFQTDIHDCPSIIQSPIFQILHLLHRNYGHPDCWWGGGANLEHIDKVGNPRMSTSLLQNSIQFQKTLVDNLASTTQRIFYRICEGGHVLFIIVKVNARTGSTINAS